MDSTQIVSEVIPHWGSRIESMELIASKDSSPGYTMEEHIHQFHELIFNFSPIPIRHTVNGQAYETTTPCIVYRAPYILHSTSTLTDAMYTRYQVAFHPCVLTEYSGICHLGHLQNQWECCIPLDSARMTALKPLLERLWRTRTAKVPKYAWCGILSALLHEVNELPGVYSHAHVQAPPYMQELLRYVVEHVDEKLTAESLAAKFYISSAKLNRDFLASTRITLHKYITAVRVSRAKIWLSEDIPLSIIAQKTGVSQESAFVYMFRRETGMTPIAWKRHFCRDANPKRTE